MVCQTKTNSHVLQVSESLFVSASNVQKKVNCNNTPIVCTLLSLLILFQCGVIASLYVKLLLCTSTEYLQRHSSKRQSNYFVLVIVT